MSYWDDLVPDYTIETALGDNGDITMNRETMRRLFFVLKSAINGDCVMLSDETGNVVAISSEFTSLFGWTLAEFQSIEPENFFHEDSLEVATLHKEHHLSSPYIARCYGKTGQSGYFKIQGLCVDFENNHWRLSIFDLIQVVQ
jgi:hypothetical protein